MEQNKQNKNILYNLQKAEWRGIMFSLSFTDQGINIKLDTSFGILMQAHWLVMKHNETNITSDIVKVTQMFLSASNPA